MSRAFVVGATGGVGSCLAAQLAERDDHVVGLHRRPEQAQVLEAAGIVPVQGDLTSIETGALATRLEGVDAVVFTAGASGAGPQQAKAVDGQGVVVAVAKAGVRRFFLVSAFPDAWPTGACRQSSSVT